MKGLQGTQETEREGRRDILLPTKTQVKRNKSSSDGQNKMVIRLRKLHSSSQEWVVISDQEARVIDEVVADPVVAEDQEEFLDFILLGLAMGPLIDRVDVERMGLDLHVYVLVVLLLLLIWDG